jgi:FkbM family methyltransferase
MGPASDSNTIKRDTMFENRRNLGELLIDGLSNKLCTWLRARSRRNGDFRGIVVPLDDVLGLRVMATGRWELTSLDAVRTLLASPQDTVGVRTTKGGMFIDVGANIGLYCIALSKYFDKIAAFEANPITFKVLEANLALTGTQNVQAFCQGVSSQTGRGSLYTPVNSNLGWATLSADRHGTEAGVVETTINLNTLDNLTGNLRFRDCPISLIKIDVEGHEAEVLRGAIGILNQWGPIVLIEVLAGEAGRESFEILNCCGYSRYYSFRRSLSSTSRGLRGYWKSLTHGLPVTFDAYDASDPRPAALVCAVKPPRGA